MIRWLRKQIQTLTRSCRNRKSELFFGFGADSESEMIEAVIGRKPEIVGAAMLENYQLCVQSLEDIPTAGDNPREILRKAWGDDFKSYTIRQHKGVSVHGTLFRIRRRERMMLDIWELVSEGWQDSVVVKVTLPNGKIVRAHTQRLPRGHNHGFASPGMTYKPWLMPKVDFVRIARQDALRYSELL